MMSRKSTKTPTLEDAQLSTVAEAAVAIASEPPEIDELLATKLSMATLCDRRTARRFLMGQDISGKVGDRLRVAMAVFRMTAEEQQAKT